MRIAAGRRSAVDINVGGPADGVVQVERDGDAIANGRISAFERIGAITQFAAHAAYRRGTVVLDGEREAIGPGIDDLKIELRAERGDAYRADCEGAGPLIHSAVRQLQIRAADRRACR